MKGLPKKPNLLLLLHLIFLLFVLFPIFSDAAISKEEDIRCLQGVKFSLKDPQGRLNSWLFGNSTVGFICKFLGVTCWNDQENRLISLQLKNLELSGKIPDSLQYCPSIQTLDLADNKIYGNIPRQICDWLPYLVTLDLSGNDLTGPIPIKLFNCKYLNKIILSNNQLSGKIPYQLVSLHRLSTFSVANNDLSGEIPSFLSNFTSTSDFDGNKGLCGSPLESKCGGKKKNPLVIIVAEVAGAAISLLFAFPLLRWASRRRGRGREGIGIFDDSKWAERLKPYRQIQVTLFKKPIVNLKLGDLMGATKNFSEESIIISTRTGTYYKAVLPDGSTLAIKRLHSCNLNEVEFRSEMLRLGQVRHPNLVRLLGFCVVRDEKLLVYMYMSNGTLFSLLHREEGDVSIENGLLDWSTRLKICVGVARGLAWLHHGCQPPMWLQNVSSNTIFLDDDFEPRITDFGLGKLINADVTHESFFISGSRRKFGYVAPEISSTTVATLKGQVYGFGVVLLELVTGRKPLEISNGEEEFNLVLWVYQLSELGQIKDVIDKSLCGKGHDEEILQVLAIAKACVITRPKERSSIYKTYQSLRIIGAAHGFSEEVDEFPLVYGKQE